jgi:hypothetical protein
MKVDTPNKELYWHFSKSDYWFLYRRLWVQFSYPPNSPTDNFKYFKYTSQIYPQSQPRVYVVDSEDSTVKYGDVQGDSPTINKRKK